MFDAYPYPIYAVLFFLKLIRGAEDIISPHGLPLDLLDRVMIIRTLPYSFDETLAILRIRAETENLKVSEEAFQKLANISTESTIR